MGNIKPIVVGSGMMARYFSASSFQRKVLIFASGVSNSKEVETREFQRERDLLEKVVERNQGLEIIYFSSTNILSPNFSAYFEHKISMEELLCALTERYYIFRLPQVVGVVMNNTLISYLARSCMECTCVDIHEYAVRNLIDVEDVIRIVTFLVNERIGAGSAQILASGSNVKVTDLVEEVCEILGVPCVINSIPKGDDQTVSIDYLRENLDDTDPVLHSDYWRCVLQKYVPQLKERILIEKANPN